MDAHQYAKARHDFETVLELNHKSIGAMTNLATLLAACPDPAVRDGKKALSLANRACELRNTPDELALHALAAAQAELGDFASAVSWQEKANATTFPPELRAEGATRLALYKSRRPYRLGQ